MYREYTRLEKDIYESYDRVINEILTTSNIYFLYANTPPQDGTPEESPILMHRPSNRGRERGLVRASASWS